MNLQQKRDEANKLLADMRALNDKALDEKRAFTSEENERFNAMERDFDALKAQIESQEQAEQRASKLDMATSFMSEPAPAKVATRNDIKSSDENADFVRMLTTNDMILARELRANLNITTANQGGYVVPASFQTSILELARELNVMRQICSVMSTSSVENIPVEATKLQMQWVAEQAQIQDSDTTFAQITLGAHKFGGIIKITDELLQDNNVNLTSYLMRKMAESVSDFEENAFLNGTGANQPQGVFAGASVGVTSASATAITADELIDLMYSVGAGYRNNGAWLISDDCERALRKLKAGDDYIWQPALVEGAPNRLLGKPVYTSAKLPAVAKNNVIAAFGDFSRYQIADRGNISIMRLDERYADMGLVGFRVYKRVDGKLLDTNAIKTLKMKAQ